MRAVWTALKARSYIVSTVDQFTRCAEKQLKGIQVILLTAEEVRNSSWMSV